MVYMLQEKKAKSRKVARPYFGPYRVLSVTPSNVEVQLIDKPAEPSTECVLAILNWEMYLGLVE